jgi:hypothetical protein
MEKPTVDELLATFGSVYGPSGPRPVVRNRSIGWSRSGEDGAIGYVSLGFDVGKTEVDVQVETRSGRPNPSGAVLLLALGRLPRNKPLRFPVRLVVTREELAIPVDGRDVIFSVYSCGKAIDARAALRGKSLRVITKSRRALRALKFEALDPVALTEHVGPPKASEFPAGWQPPPFKWPTARDATRAFPDGALGIAGPLGVEPHPAAGWDKSLETVSGVHLFHMSDSARHPITVRTTREEPDLPDVLRDLLARRSNETLRTRLSFPVDLSISRERAAIAIDDRPTPIVVYSCGRTATVTGNHDLGAFTIECSRSQLKELSLRTVGSSELRRNYRRQ